MGIEVQGIDPERNSCSLAELDIAGAELYQKAPSVAPVARLSGRFVSLNCCDGAHHIGRFAFNTDMSHD